MSDYIDKALFVHGESDGDLIESLRSSGTGATIEPVAIADFLAEPTPYLEQASHVVVAAPLAEIKQVLRLAADHAFGVGLIPNKSQRILRDAYALPAEKAAQIELALRAHPTPLDLTLCNNEVLLLRAILGRLPLLDAAAQHSRVRILLHALRALCGLRLNALRVVTAEGKQVQTAACGCTIVQRFERARASQLFTRSNSLTDGMLSLVIMAPMSVASYLQALTQFLSGRRSRTTIPVIMGYIRSRGALITSESPLPVSLDGLTITSTPLQCEIRPRVLHLNIGAGATSGDNPDDAVKEVVEVGNLPAGKELIKARETHIPLFGYASEERFRDLFRALHEDARINGTYVILMVLSALLATVGLFLSSSSVVIGAMLLAPLMAPIMSLAMGLVRQDDQLAFRSIHKILIGIVIALAVSALFSLMITHKPVTPEMTARLNPSLLDLAVAILAGVAGAYTKSFKEILQSLAGVAIAVALVPPLAVAGIGLGRADFVFFGQAFLLFLTNLTGIIVSAAVVFRILGYSAAVRNRRGMAVVLLMLLGVTIPLYFSYRAIVKTETLERNWRHERFLVGGKYLIVEKADLQRKRDHHILYVDVLAREPVTRHDLAQFKEKVKMHFSQRLIVRVRITYIL